MIFSPSRRNFIRRGLAWSGLVLMVICFIWLQVLPAPEEPLLPGKPGLWREPAVALVIIDAGHGGQDSGAMHNGVLEKDLTLDVARRIEGLARAHGLRTMMTRPSDISVSLAARAAAANRENDCVFVSIHFDEGNRPVATGVQTFYAAHQQTGTALSSWLPFLQPALPQAVNFESQSLAAAVQAALVTRTHAFDRGTRAEQFFVVANVRHPAVLVEAGFLSNNEDLARLATEGYRQELATGITEGVLRYRDALNQRASLLTLGTAPPE